MASNPVPAPCQPLVELVLLCDTVLRDRIEGKWSAVGIINQLLCVGFPAHRPKLGVYVRLADVYQDIPVTIRVSWEEGRPLAGTEQIVRAQPHRHGGEEIGGYIEDIVIEHPGRLMVQVMFRGEILGQTKLDVVDISHLIRRKT